MTKLTMPLRGIKQGESDWYPYGLPEEMGEADYDEHEAAEMRRLVRLYEEAAPGSKEREEALNSLRTLHEIKALLDGRMLTDDEAAAFGPPRARETPSAAPMTLPGMHKPEPVVKHAPALQASLLDVPAPVPKEKATKAAKAERDNWVEPDEKALPGPARSMVGHYRKDGPATMEQAAHLVYPRSGSDRLRVLVFIVENEAEGATDWEIEQHLRMKHQTASARRRELEKDGWLEPTGKTRPTDTGTPAQTYRVTEQGLAKWAEHAKRKVAAA